MVGVFCWLVSAASLNITAIDPGLVTLFARIGGMLLFGIAIYIIVVGGMSREKMR
jgi:hypothetical protein